jgi:hypothetical protein
MMKIMLVFVVYLCSAMSGLTAQLSVQPSWMSREYIAAVNGHSLLQLPATTLRAQVQ